MTLLDSYIKGDTIGVYSQIERLGKDAFSEKYSSDVEAVLSETMRRAARNLEIIHDELKSINYNFKREIQYSFEDPIRKPAADTQKLLTQLDNAVRPFGSVPHSLKTFYQIVGSCNFAWDYETNKTIPWLGSDPIQITPLDTLVEEVTSEYWFDEMNENKEMYGEAYLILSADYLHKDNISGGPAYAIEIPSSPSMDGALLNEEHQTTFINYLRIIFENCGFGRTDDIDGVATYEAFYDKVSPRLYKI